LNQPGASGKYKVRRGSVHERLDSVRNVRALNARGNVTVVALNAGDTVRQPRLVNALIRQSRLNRTQRDSGCADRQPFSEVAQARPDTATEINKVRRIRRRGQRARELRNAFVHVVKGRRPSGDARSPHRAMNGAVTTALPEPDERARMPVVVVADFRGRESRHIRAVGARRAAMLRGRHVRQRCANGPHPDGQGGGRASVR
jgi:hypothetical protein